MFSVFALPVVCTIIFPVRCVTVLGPFMYLNSDIPEPAVDRDFWIISKFLIVCV